MLDESAQCCQPAELFVPPEQAQGYLGSADSQPHCLAGWFAASLLVVELFAPFGLAPDSSNPALHYLPELLLPLPVAEWFAEPLVANFLRVESSLPFGGSRQARTLALFRLSGRTQCFCPLESLQSSDSEELCFGAVRFAQQSD